MYERILITSIRISITGIFYTSPLPPKPPCCILYLPAAPNTSLLPPIPARCLLYLPDASYTSLLPPTPPRFFLYRPVAS